MSQATPTVKIKPSHESQGAYVEINDFDFDPSKHELYEEPKSEPKAKRKAAQSASE